MFLLPFVFAGVFMLTALNPRYVTTLISQAIPQTRLLGFIFSPIAGLLTGPPPDSSGSRRLQPFWRPLPLHSSSDLPETITIGRSSSRGKLGICGSTNSSFWASGHGDACYEGQHQASPANTEGLELLVLLLLLCLLWTGCSSLVDRFRVTEPLCPAKSVVEDLTEQRSPRAFTPSNSVEFGDLFADEVKKEHPPIPAQLNFVTSLNQEDSDGSSFTVNTGAAIDTIPALPMRVSPGHVSSPGGLDELELLHMESSPTSPHIDTFFEDRIDTLLEDEEIALRMAQGLARLLADSRRAPFVSSAQSLTRTRNLRANSTFIPAPTTSTPALVLPSELTDVTEQLNARAAPRVRSQTHCPLSPLLEEAITLARVKPEIIRGASSYKDILLSTSSSPTHASIEEVEDLPQDASKAEGPQSQQRHRKPPVTVWPRVPLEMRRSRMPSSQPLRTAADTSTWDQPRRSRTMSGV